MWPGGHGHFLLEYKLVLIFYVLFMSITVYLFTHGFIEYLKDEINRLEAREQNKQHTADNNI